MGFSEGLVVVVACAEDVDIEPRVAFRSLEPGALAPSPGTPNFESVRDVARLTTEALEEVVPGPRPRRLTLGVVLPDLCVTTAVLSPSRGESERERIAEFHSKLPFPADEARSDTWRGSSGEILAAAVRLGVVRQYEQIVEAADCRIGWVDGASLSSLPRWLGDQAKNEGAPADALSLRILLYSSHYTVATRRGPELVGLRTRLRARGDGVAVAGELARIPSLFGARSIDRVFIAGADAEECAALLHQHVPEAKVDLADPSEAAILGSSIAAVARRRYH